MSAMNISQAAAAAAVTPKMVRHYESLGLEQLSAPLPARLALALSTRTRALKEVKAGSRIQGARRRQPSQRPAHHAHSALELWSRSTALPM